MIDDGLTEDERDSLLCEVQHLLHMLAERDEEVKRLRAEIIQLEQWNGEIAFNARIFADALKEINRIVPKHMAGEIARAALEGAND